MSIEEIFSEIYFRMKEGISFHEQMVQVFNFLNLKGYEECQLYHYHEEVKHLILLQEYYSTKFYKLIPPKTKEEPTKSIIPQTWYKYSYLDVDTNTKRQSVKDYFRKWVEWEKSTKEFFESLLASAHKEQYYSIVPKLSSLVDEVSEELDDAQRQLTNLENTNYDIVFIMEAQDSLYKNFYKKIKGLYND